MNSNSIYWQLLHRELLFFGFVYALKNKITGFHIRYIRSCIVALVLRTDGGDAG